MTPQTLACISALAALVPPAATTALGQNIAYQPPAGGWAYYYDGSAAAYGSAGAFNSLDGTWNRGAPGQSDAWDGSGLGGPYGVGNAPGGVEVGTDGATTFLRMQDTGDPRNSSLGWVDPCNRKIAFGHDLATHGFGNTFIDSGVTISFRARVPTGALDDLWTRNSTTTIPYPAGGDGYTYFGEGLCSISLCQYGSGSTTIGFSLATAFDATYDPNYVPGLVITDGGGGQFVQVPLADPTAWHEFWITIVAGGTETHRVNIYRDGFYAPITFDITAGDNSNDYLNYNWMGMGVGATGSPGLGSGALDVDFYAIKSGVIAPVPEPGTLNLIGLGVFLLTSRCRRRGRK